MSRGPDVCTQIERALVCNAAEAGVVFAQGAAVSIPWASVTFAGARHRLTMVAARSASLDAWLASLPEAEFRLRGHLVADLAITGVTRTGDPVEVTLEILTVEDC
jgi:hypothetical protein